MVELKKELVFFHHTLKQLELMLAVAVITKTASRNNRQTYSVKVFINDKPVITGTVINESNEETLIIGIVESLMTSLRSGRVF